MAMMMQERRERPERPPATARRGYFGRYILLGYAEADLQYNIGALQNIARQIEMDVFGVEREYAIEDVKFNFRPGAGGSMTVVADAETLVPVGYSSQRVLAPTLEGYRRRVMFTSTRAINEALQGEGLGPETLRFSFNMHGAPDFVAGIMGWAPPVIAYYKSEVVAELEGEERAAAEANIEPSGDDELDRIKKQLAVVKLYPVFKRHNQSPLIAGVLEHTLKQSRYSGIPYDPETGLMQGLWEKDSSMLFRAEKASRRVKIIGDILKNQFKCDPATGDALVVIGPKKGWRAFID